MHSGRLDGATRDAKHTMATRDSLRPERQKRPSGRLTRCSVEAKATTMKVQATPLQPLRSAVDSRATSAAVAPWPRSLGHRGRQL